MGENLYWCSGDVILIMEYLSYDWADSVLEKIQIEFDSAQLTIWNDALQKHLLVSCSGLAGMTTLFFWDDDIIMGTSLHSVDFESDPFLNKLLCAYDINWDFGGRSLKNGMLILQIELSSNTSFSIYCQKVDVFEAA